MERFISGNFVPIKGDILSPLRGGDYIYGRLFDINTRHAAIFMSSRGLVLIEHGVMRLLSETDPALVGTFPKVLDLPDLGEVWIVTDRGIFDLDANETRKEIDLPFPIDESEPAILSVPELKSVLIFSINGVYSVRRSVGFARVPGGSGIVPSPVEAFAGIIPVSHDVMLAARNSLMLLINSNSPRWQRCQADLREPLRRDRH